MKTVLNHVAVNVKDFNWYKEFFENVCNMDSYREEVGLPIYAKGVASGAAAKSGVGDINVTVSCGGVVVHPGDIIVGDRNGVVVLPPDEKKIREIIVKADRKNEAQKWTIDEMFRTGEVMPKVIYRP